MEQITIEQMKTLNRLSGFCFSDEALQQEKASLEGLLECFELLQTLDTGGICPDAQVLPSENVWREDVEAVDRKEMLGNAPLVKDRAIVVPATRKKQESFR